MGASHDCWYLAQLKPGGIDLAERNLKRQGFETFMPRQEVSRRRAGRIRLALRPLFPGYLFVRVCSHSKPWRVINSTLGVSKLISQGLSRPTIGPYDIVSSLQARVDNRGVLVSPAELKAGDKARIILGPLTDAMATIEEIPEQQRVSIVIEMMERNVRVTLPLRNLEPV